MSDIVKITVGTGKFSQTFSIHEPILTKRSEFFAKAMCKDWEEAEEKTVKLAEDEPETLALYMQLVYTGKIPAFNKASDRVTYDVDDGQPSCAEPELGCEEYESLVLLYVLAEKLQDIKTKNLAVDAIASQASHQSENMQNTEKEPCLHGTTAICMMYGNTPDHCPGR